MIAELPSIGTQIEQELLDRATENDLGFCGQSHEHLKKKESPIFQRRNLMMVRREGIRPIHIKGYHARRVGTESALCLRHTSEIMKDGSWHVTAVREVPLGFREYSIPVELVMKVAQQRQLSRGAEN